MKHVLINIIAAFLIFSFVTYFIPDLGTDASEAEAVSPLIPNYTADDTALGTSLQNIGFICDQVDTAEEITFRKSLRTSLDSGSQLKVYECYGSGDTELSVMRKMINDGCQIIFAELFDGSPESNLVQLAKNSGIYLILFGKTPSDKLLSEYDKIYYFGDRRDALAFDVAKTVSDIWKNSSFRMDINEDDVLQFSVIADIRDDYELKKNTFMAALNDSGIESEHLESAALTYFDFDFESAVDSILKSDTELIICTTSDFGKMVADYLNDKKEFPKKPNISVAVLSADKTALQLVAEGKADCAVGYDADTHGKQAAALCSVIFKNKTPDKNTLNLEISGNKLYYKNISRVYSNYYSTMAFATAKS